MYGLFSFIGPRGAGRRTLAPAPSRGVLGHAVVGDAGRADPDDGEAGVVTALHLADEVGSGVRRPDHDEAVQRRTFRGLRTLRDALQEEGLWLPTLSMGMSADYGIAVEEGATVIRLGTVLFGPRAEAAT